jgi:hypothetical protein
LLQNSNTKTYRVIKILCALCASSGAQRHFYHPVQLLSVFKTFKFHPVEILPLYLSTQHERLGSRSNREILSEIPSCLNVRIFLLLSLFQTRLNYILTVTVLFNMLTIMLYKTHVELHLVLDTYEHT